MHAPYQRGIYNATITGSHFHVPGSVSSPPQIPAAAGGYPRLAPRPVPPAWPATLAIMDVSAVVWLMRIPTVSVMTYLTHYALQPFADGSPDATVPVRYTLPTCTHLLPCRFVGTLPGSQLRIKTSCGSPRTLYAFTVSSCPYLPTLRCAAYPVPP